MKVSLVWLVGCFLLSACDKGETEIQSRLDKISAALVSDHKTNQDGRSYLLRDIDRGQHFARLLSPRTITVGDFIRLGDDLWIVQAVQILTKQMPTEEGDTLPEYRLNYTQLIVKFSGKADLAPAAN